MTSPVSCEEHSSVFTEGLMPYEILALTAPNNSTVWEGRDSVWDAFFYTYIAVLAALFLTIGVITTLLLIRRECVRLKTKLFFTVYTCIAILCYSRVLWLLLDPFGLIGFIGNIFSGWFIISRLVETVGFPSLNTSYTLIILALLRVSNKPKEPWHYQWKVILPVPLCIYGIAYGAEIISLTVPYPGVITVVLCQYLLSIVIVVFSLLFLTVSNRLLWKLAHSERRSVRLSETPSSAKDLKAAVEKKFASNELQRHQAKTRRTKRKIVVITYATMVVCIAYALLTIGRGILTTYLLFGACLGFQGQRASAVVWLSLDISQRSTEVVFAVILLYSVTDLSAFKKTISCMR